MAEQPVLYIVVCSELHTAIGPFIGPEGAYETAKRMTHEESGSCVYVPIALQVEGAVMIQRPGEQPVQDVKARGYL